VAIFQHSLPFLQSESFQTHVGKIHRRAIGPLAHHNGTSAYTSLTRHLQASTIECLHRPRYKLACFSHAISRYELSLPTKRSPQPNTHVYTRTISRPGSSVNRNFSIVASLFALLLRRLFSLLRGDVRFHCCVTKETRRCTVTLL
jgi:hypothetical protein